MASNDMEKAAKRWRKTLREISKHAKEEALVLFLASVRSLKESLDRMESKMLTEESDGFKQTQLFA